MADTFVQWVGLYLLTLATVVGLVLFVSLRLLSVLVRHLEIVHKQNKQIAELLAIIMRRLE